MLTPFDDYLIHQTIDTLDHVATGDPRFQDRGLFNVHTAGADFLFQIGFGVYPNRNMIDGWICGVRGDQQFNLRAARPLCHDRSNLAIGPIDIEILKPMASWRIAVADNPYGVRCDIAFHARTKAYEFKPSFVRRNNMIEHHQMHVMQSGTYEGWVEINGTRFDAGLIGSRDRSWGVRGPFPNQQMDLTSHSLGDAPAPRPAQVDHTRRAWIAAEFNTRTVHGWFWTDHDGRALIADGSVIDVQTGNDKPRFAAWARPSVLSDADGLPRSMSMKLIDECGETVVLDARPLACRSPEGNGYFKGFYGRQWPGLHVEGEHLDMSDPEFRRAKGYMNGPMLTEFTLEGEVGYGVLITALMARNS
jgi:hypothetical protein